MKFEKLSENKIRITLSTKDLAEKNIDFHIFMSNTLESQDILLDMLEEAKKQTGFDPENYNLKIEALCMANTNFIFTITKIVPELETDKSTTKTSRKKFIVKRKDIPPSASEAVYSFDSFDDFCNFLCFIKECNLINSVNNIANSIILYSYKQKYYLLIRDINLKIVNKIKFYTIITEFAKYVTNSKIFAGKLNECGNIFVDNNAFKIGLEHFI